MDIQLFNDTLKIKTKKATIAVDPAGSIAKFDADAIILMSINTDVSRINNYRLVIEAPGEYEISGLKISGVSSENGVIFILNSDNTNTLLAKASSLDKVSPDKIGECQVAIINADTVPNQTILTAIEPRIVVLFGANAKEAAKNLGGIPESLGKVSFAEDKLPEELKIMLLA